jgi:hypothetical protein
VQAFVSRALFTCSRLALAHQSSTALRLSSLLWRGRTNASNLLLKASFCRLSFIAAAVCLSEITQKKEYPFEISQKSMSFYPILSRHLKKPIFLASGGGHAIVDKSSHLERSFQ